jgi:hypothetical protein
LRICPALGEAGDAGQDFIGAFGPHKGFWIDIVCVEKRLDGAIQLAHAAMGITSNLFHCEFGEPTFHDV